MQTDSSPPPAPAQVPTGRNRFAIATWLFLRLLGLIHLIAFVSFWVQLEGLVGPHGLLPATRYFTAVRNEFGSAAFFQLPSLCLFFGTESFLHVLCAGGTALSFLVMAGLAQVFCLALLWAAYFSLSCAGQVFLNFQWDTLLLETTFLAIFLAPWSLTSLGKLHDPPRPTRLLPGWLLFRLMFLAGIVKLASGDPSWRDLSALTFHYETQPLPTSLAWYVHQLPAWPHRASCFGIFVIELLVPFFLFAPRPLRHNAALIVTALMATIALTGNYTFFNLLTAALCLLSIDDAFWHHLLPRRLPLVCHLIDDKLASPSQWQRWMQIPVAGFVLGYTTAEFLPIVFRGLGPPPGFNAGSSVVAPFRSFNTYGLFAVMTNPRPELIFEGSDDGRAWLTYEFPVKPGDLTRRPTWVAPHQPRLDWQLWFAALEPPAQNSWVLSFCEHLLRGTPEVLTLFAHNPFPGKPPRNIRGVRYEYPFTDADPRARTGQWWRRTPLDFYVPVANLR